MKWMRKNADLSEGSYLSKRKFAWLPTLVNNDQYYVWLEMYSQLYVLREYRNGKEWVELMAHSINKVPDND